MTSSARWRPRSPGRCSTARRFAPRPARVKERTGSKGKSLFHPIRVALTGETGGPELDLAVPAIDRGASLPPAGEGRTDRELPRPSGSLRRRDEQLSMISCQ